MIVRGEAAPASTRLNKRTVLLREDMTVLSAPKLLAHKPLSDPVDITRNALIEIDDAPGGLAGLAGNNAGVGETVVSGGHRVRSSVRAIQAVRATGLGSVGCNGGTGAVIDQTVVNWLPVSEEI